MYISAYKGTNNIGARTVESIVQLYPSILTKPLKAEFYGQKFLILAKNIGKDMPGTLKELILSNPSKKDAILDHMVYTCACIYAHSYIHTCVHTLTYTYTYIQRSLVNKFIEKNLLEFSYVHHLIYEYSRELCDLESNSDKRVEELVKLLSDQVTKLGMEIYKTHVCLYVCI